MSTIIAPFVKEFIANMARAIRKSPENKEKDQTRPDLGLFVAPNHIRQRALFAS